MQTGIQQLQIQKFTGSQPADTADMLAVEEPLEIIVQYHHRDTLVRKNISVTMRTPGNDAALAAGFLFTEGIITSYHSIAAIREKDGDVNKTTVVLQPGVLPMTDNTERNFYTTSSCGVCGKASIDAIKTHPAYTDLPDTLQVTPGFIYSLPQKARDNQALFAHTGGLHAAALFNQEGELLLLQEDVGRHNAMDKLVGAAAERFMLPLNRHILLLSGRSSFELVQKAAMAGVRLVVSVGPPSTLAVQMAREANCTLIGFVRDRHFNIYSGTHRIKPALI